MHLYQIFVLPNFKSSNVRRMIAIGNTLLVELTIIINVWLREKPEIHSNQDGIIFDLELAFAL